MMEVVIKRVNTVGSYNCECNEGYNLNSDEHGCDGKMKIR